MNVLGVSAGYHDSACCLLKDGAIIAAAQEERFSRVKNDRSFPRRAFRYCLDQAGLAISDLDCVAFYEDPTLKLARQMWMGLLPGVSVQRRNAILGKIVGPSSRDILRDVTGYDGRLEFVEHHLSHAASSYYVSGFPDAAILTVDGVGDWATTTYGSGHRTHIERFEQVDFPHSLGLLYSAITGYLGFEVNEGEYKVMGLAPYGNPRYVDKMHKLIEVGSKGDYRLNLKYFAFHTDDAMFTEELCSLFGRPSRRPESEILQFHMDVAKSAQIVLEEILIDKVKYLYDKVSSDNLCMAGGVALNVVANSRCLRESPFKRLFVQPAAGDAGGAMGAAAVAYVRLAKEVPVFEPLSRVYLGPATSNAEVYQILRSSSARFRDFRNQEEELISFTIDRLSEGKVVGWCHGRMEFGPRALGARSILADPRRSEMRDRTNDLVKMRESFRPFAPSVLESEVAEHFDLDHPSPFMLETCRVRSPIPLPAITHVDGSARVQTVNSQSNRRYAALLLAFYKRTGCPILLNTSLNMRGEPIVCTAADAIMCFVRSRMDVLVLEDFVLEREGIPLMWELAAQPPLVTKDAEAEVGHLVYALL